MKLDIKDDFEKSEFLRDLVDKHEIVMDNSSFTNWDACYAKGVIAGALKKQGTRGEINLDFGSCVHEAMETKFLGGSIQDQVMAAIWSGEAVQSAKADGFEAPTESEHHDKWLRLPVNEGIKSQEQVRKLIAAYHVHYSMGDDYDVLYLDGKPMVEQSFRFPMGQVSIELATEELLQLFCVEGNTYNKGDTVTIQIYWQGKIDLICRWRNQLWVLDHKTTSVMGPKFMDSFYRASQMLGYFWACNELVRYGYEKFEVKTAEGNMVPVDGSKLQGVLVNALAVRKSGFQFETFPMPIPKPNVEEWVDDTLQRFGYLILQTADYYATQNLVPTREHCVTKYGRCEFYDVCEAPAKMRKALLNSPTFKTSTWSPLK